MFIAAASQWSLLFVAFGGVLFGAVGATLVLTYAWNAQNTARDIWLNRFRAKLRSRFVEDSPEPRLPVSAKVEQQD